MQSRYNFRYAVQALPFSIQSFINIRKFNCLYIDKTRYAHDLIVQRQSFFLSRPRRFGKSVFVSTLKEILLGNKDLFDGLWIASSNYTWPIYGVIHKFDEMETLDFNRGRKSRSCVIVIFLGHHIPRLTDCRDDIT